LFPSLFLPFSLFTLFVYFSFHSCCIYSVFPSFFVPLSLFLSVSRLCLSSWLSIYLNIHSSIHQFHPYIHPIHLSVSPSTQRPCPLSHCLSLSSWISLG
jgi:hypothetical protein